MKPNATQGSFRFLITFGMASTCFNGQLYLQGATASTAVAATAQGPDLKTTWADSIEAVQLADPSSLAFQFKSTTPLPFGPKIDEDFRKLSLVAAPDIVKASSYHPKEHANLTAGAAFEYDWFPTQDDANNVCIFILNAGGGIETAPVLAQGSVSDSSWKTDNTKGDISLVIIPPYFSEWTKKRINFPTEIKFNLASSYLDRRKESLEQKNGWRNKASVLAWITLHRRYELWIQYDYTWGSALGSDKHFYLVEVSRSVGGTWIESFLKNLPLVGDQDNRLFVRYYDGGVAPLYKKTHGFEFGIGAKVF